MASINCVDLNQLADDIKRWGKELGFQYTGIADIDLSKHESRLTDWLEKGYHGDMHFMEEHGLKRARPSELLPGTLRVVSVRLNYLPPDASFAKHLSDPNIGYISRYALGRDYHKVLRNKLKHLGKKIEAQVPDIVFRPFTDSAPVLEHALAEKAGSGWTGKHTLTLSKDGGSWFFLGELFVNLPLPTDTEVEENCGECTACITMCPTQAIVAPYTVDARKCISYLTIEYDGVIPKEYRPLIGNRIYGCDDCQLVCPWNRYAHITEESDFLARKTLHGQTLSTLFSWDEQTFLKNTEGSPIRRIGFQKWSRNLVIAMGNAPYSTETIQLLESRLHNTTDMVATHIKWALTQQHNKANQHKEMTRHTGRLVRIVEKGLPRDA